MAKKMKISNIIHLRGMEFYGFHGVLPEEKALGQKFIVDVDIEPLKLLNSSDKLTETVNYAQVYMAVKDCVETGSFDLLETLADEIARRLLQDFSCRKVRVEVHKPQAPIAGILKDVSVEVVWEK